VLQLSRRLSGVKKDAKATAPIGKLERPRMILLSRLCAMAKRHLPGAGTGGWL
jgi:hypothetical protein